MFLLFDSGLADHVLSGCIVFLQGGRTGQLARRILRSAAPTAGDNGLLGNDGGVLPVLGERGGWIADRICCLSVATEIRRIILGSQPAFKLVRTFLETDPSANELLSRCIDPARRPTIPVIFSPAVETDVYNTATGSQMMAMATGDLQDREMGLCRLLRGIAK